MLGRVARRHGEPRTLPFPGIDVGVVLDSVGQGGDTERVAGVDLRGVQYGRVEYGLVANDAAFGHLIGPITRLDQQRVQGFVEFYSPGCAAWQQEVIAVAELQVPVVAEQVPAATMHEQQVATVTPT